MMTLISRVDGVVGNSVGVELGFASLNAIWNSGPGATGECSNSMFTSATTGLVKSVASSVLMISERIMQITLFQSAMVGMNLILIMSELFAMIVTRKLRVNGEKRKHERVSFTATEGVINCHC